jgi:hypothetical protein
MSLWNSLYSFTSAILLTCSLYEVHEMNAYSANARPSACFESITAERIYILVWMLCYWRLPQNYTFKFPTVANTSMADARTCEVGATRTFSLALQA